MSIISRQSHRNDWIDALRGFAATSVAFFHFTAISSPAQTGVLQTAWIYWFQFGHIGVAVFFAVSGYCIGHSWLKTANPRNFAWKRARRIMPPYWASLLLLVFLSIGARLLNGHNDIAVLPRTPEAILATLTLTTAPFSSVPTASWVYWTLTAEIAFYLVLTLLLFIPAVQRINALITVHAAFCLATAFHLTPSHGPFFFINYWPLFGLGLVIALAEVNRRAAFWFLAFSAVHFALFMLFPPQLTIRSPGFSYLVTSLTTAIVIWGSARCPLPLVFRPAQKLGLFSYSLYLVHVPVGVCVIARLLPPSSSDASYLLNQLVTFVGTAVVARLFFSIAEAPFMNSTAKA